MLTAALASLALLAPAGWAPDTQAANAFADGRAGQVSFAVRTEDRLRGRAPDTVVHSLSLVKAVLLVAQLQAARDRALTAAERRDLRPMIRESSNAAASRVVRRLGRERIERAARRAGMPRFRLAARWGLSATTARDETRFFLRIDTAMPSSHRAYGMRLLQTVVPAQRWGIADVVPAGWTAAFKGGWTDGPGLSEHQVALLTRGDERVAIAVMSTGQPDHAYARRGLRGLFARLLATAR
jgi:Beta-lactamase enzyme family